MHEIKEQLKRLFCPAPLQSTRDVAQRVAEAQLSHRGLPFCPPHEGDLIYQLASAPSDRCLEIGFATGSTALYLLAGIEGKENGEVVSIDFKQSDFEYLGCRMVSQSANASRHTLIEGNTNTVLPEMFKDGVRFDLAFLDGWKVFDHLLLDVYYAVRMLNEGGYIVFDDARMKSTRKVISILIRYYGFSEVNYSKYETWKHRVWFGLSQGMKDWRRPYRAFVKPAGFATLPAITVFDFWKGF